MYKNFSIKLSRHNILKQLSTSHQVKYQIIIAIFLHSVMQPHDIIVIQLSTNPRFSFEFLLVSRRKSSCVDDFSREVCFICYFHTPSDNRKSALSQFFFQIVIIAELAFQRRSGARWVRDYTVSRHFAVFCCFVVVYRLKFD